MDFSGETKLLLVSLWLLLTSSRRYFGRRLHKRPARKVKQIEWNSVTLSRRLCVLFENCIGASRRFNQLQSNDRGKTECHGDCPKTGMSSAGILQSWEWMACLSFSLLRRNADTDTRPSSSWIDLCRRRRLFCGNETCRWTLRGAAPPVFCVFQLSPPFDPRSHNSSSCKLIRSVSSRSAAPAALCSIPLRSSPFAVRI